MNLKRVANAIAAGITAFFVLLGVDYFQSDRIPSHLEKHHQLVIDAAVALFFAVGTYVWHRKS